MNIKGKSINFAYTKLYDNQMRASVVEGEGRVMLDNDVGTLGLSELAQTFDFSAYGLGTSNDI